MSTKSVHVALIGILFACTAGAQSTNWDGTYSAIFDLGKVHLHFCQMSIATTSSLVTNL